MISDLFVLASAVSEHAVLSAIPPVCRRGIEPAGSPLTRGAEALIEGPEWIPRRPARHFLPSVSLLGARPTGHAVRFEVSVRRSGAWTPWAATATLGPGAFEPLPPAPSELVVDVDAVTSPVPVDAVRLRLRLGGAGAADLARRPWLLTLSACDPPVDAGAPHPGSGSRRPVDLDVPPASQMTAPEALRPRICSPACVTMVLGYWGVQVPVTEVAAEVFHAGLDLYGVWPAAIRAAAGHGVPGYLLRFPGWDAAAWCLERGLPVIASVRYGQGELDGAAMPATSGHLVVLRGHQGPWVLVNDPAAETAATVPRRYRRDQLESAWLGHSGVGYVLFRPEG